MRILLSYGASEFVFRQTPHSAGIWENCTFSSRADDGVFDGWVVFDSMESPNTALCDPRRTIFITGEPASVRDYDSRFLGQFAAVISPHGNLKHPCVFRQQPAIPWWVGVLVDHQPAKQSSAYNLDYDRLKKLNPGPKKKLLSVICSNKTLTPGHRERLQFLQRLIEHFGSKMDVFGHGFRAITDKWDAIYPYRYHIVLENARADHYWTEKIADTFLASAFPLYCGCPNLGDYFPQDSFQMINRAEPDAAVEIITEAINGSLYEKSLASLAKARELVLDTYNLFPVIVNTMRALPATDRMRVTLRPESDFIDPLPRRWKRRLRQMLFPR